MPSILHTLSDELAAAVQAAAPSVVQVQGQRRAAAGVVFAADLVLTSSRGLDHTTSVRDGAGAVLEGTVVGRGRTTSLAVVRVPGLTAPPASPAGTARPGHLAQAVGRTWSGGVFAAFAPVAVVGGPLGLGRGVEIPEVMRIGVAPHGALTGGALIDHAGHVLGIVTGTAIRGTTVVVPSEFAWADATDVVATGGVRQGYLGLGSMPVTLGDAHRAYGHETGLLVTSVAASGPAEAAGVLVGDVLVRLATAAVADADDLLALLRQHAPGTAVTLGLLRGATPVEVVVTLGERHR